MGPRLHLSGRRARLAPLLLAAVLALLVCVLAFVPCAGAASASARSHAASAPAPPSATTSHAAHATYSSVIVYGYVNPHGVATGYAFQYGTTTGYGGQTALAPVPSKTKSVKVRQTIAALAAGTTYHYRIVAVNGAGLTYGRDRTFHTRSVPLSLQITGVPNPVTYGEPFQVEGTLSGTGAANREVALQSNLYPYTGGFQIVGNPELTSATGGFSFPYLGLVSNAQLRVVTVGATIVSSPIVTENVAVRVTFHARRTRRRGWMRLYGTVSPAEVGARVGFQLLAPGKSINQGGAGVHAATSTMSRFKRTVRIRHPGVYRALVVISDPAHVSAYSPPIYIR